jgi:ABC-type multidrug transport system fused ATPase/permease subunit
MIVEQGLHKELIAKKGLYAELFEQQLVEESKENLKSL